VPGYDRTVPPGLNPFLRALNLPNISYLRAIQPRLKPWAESYSPFGAWVEGTTVGRQKSWSTNGLKGLMHLTTSP
jgi:hypothetical protein